MTLTFVLALLPIIWLIIALTILKIPGFKACAIGMGIAYILAVFVWKMPLFDSITAVVEGAAPYTFSWLTTPGLWIILSAIIGGKIQGATFLKIFSIFKNTVFQLSKTIITIISIMASAKLMGYSGMISSIAMMFVSLTGSFYPLFAPLLGAIGTFVTGSGTSASVLFGGLQLETSVALNLNQSWIAASNTAGAITAKMISPQSIAVAVAAVNLQGKESVLLKGAIKYFILFLIIVGIFTYTGIQILF